MPTIYEKTTGGLIATGDRQLQTFQSGLIRVDRSYICRNEIADLYRVNELFVGAQLPQDSAVEAVDGLFIFPEVQSVRRPDGFTEFRVSAYGRSTLGFTDERQFGEVDLQSLGDDIAASIRKIYSVYVVRRFVRRATETLDFGVSTIEDFFSYYDEDSAPFDIYGESGDATVTQPIQIVDPTIRSFGIFDEWEVTIKPYVRLVYGSTS